MLRVGLLSVTLWMSACAPLWPSGNKPVAVRYPAAAACHPGRAADVRKTAVPGRPFAAIASPDGCWIFASLNGARGGIGVFRWTGSQLELQRVVPVAPQPAGLALTHDGRLLVVADARFVEFFDVPRLVNGAADALLGSVRDADAPGSVYLAISEDDRTLFVSDEGIDAVTVLDLREARRSGFPQSAVLGSIPTGHGPVGLALSRGGRYLFITTQFSTGHHWPVACGSRDRFRPEPAGAVEVVDVERARIRPAEAAIGQTPASCSPVRAVLSPDGAHLYVSARGSNALLAFDVTRLVSDPAHALITTVPVGTAPVGLEVAADGQQVIVANSSRFGGGGGQSLTVIDTSNIDQGRASVIGTLAVGKFPRELHATPDGEALILTDYESDEIELIPLARLPAGKARTDTQQP
jgi:DNA-binding beta-propeller fold protein YncE